MKRIFPIVIKDLQQYAKNVQMLVFLFVMPIAFTFLFGAVFADEGTDTGIQWNFAVVNADQGTTGAQIIEHLKVDESLQVTVVENSAEELYTMVADGDYTAALLIPADYTSQLENGHTPELLVYTRGSSDVQTLLENSIVFAAVNPANLHIRANELAEIYETQTGTDADSFREGVYGEMVEASQIPNIETTYITRPGSEENKYGHTAPGMILQFAISGMIGIASIFVDERQNQTFSRIRSTGAKGFSYLAGHGIAFLILLTIQFSTMILFGQFILKLPYFEHLLATIIITAATVTSFTMMGLLIGVFSKNQGQAIVFSLVAMFIFSALGGAWVPLEYTSATFQVIGQFTPVAWGMEGFKAVLVHGGGAADVIVPSLVLLGYGVVFLVLALLVYGRRKEA